MDLSLSSIMIPYEPPAGQRRYAQPRADISFGHKLPVLLIIHKILPGLAVIILRSTLTGALVAGQKTGHPRKEAIQNAIGLPPEYRR